MALLFHNRIMLRPRFALLALILTGLVAAAIGDENKRFYIVYLGDDVMRKESAHVDVLTTLKGSSNEAKESIVYSYTKSFNAFAAKLSENEADELSAMEEVVSVVQNRYHELHTTRSWDFLGLSQTARRKLHTESDIIVGLLDTGITPDSESFEDKGFGPPPTKWKGTCGRFANFSGCNNKLIGARYFKLDGNTDPSDILSPVDVDGHGTHTSSTLAGNLVPGANLYGLAEGTARGAVPSARVAMYKVCWTSSGCADMDILAAFEAAIHDGVDVISISIGGMFGSYAVDSISVGSYHAMKKGIVTVASAGNGGPEWGSVLNHAPWIVTVAASGIDREFRSKVELGNGQTFSGIGVSGFDPKQKTYPLVSGGDVFKDSLDKQNARMCLPDSMESSKVKGRVVFCELGAWGVDSVVKGIGGVGAILQSSQYLDAAQIFMAPATMVNVSVGISINNYIHSTRSPSAIIYKTEELKAEASLVASFSSRGPNPGTQRILKPDIAAPGIDILAAYTMMKSLTGLVGDTQYSKYTLMSGTSMACPHVAGIAAYIKSFHPHWSPAAIKSAIITAAKPMSRRKNKNAEFGFGAGQINPTKSLNPGLIYDIDSEMPYIQFLCREGYTGPSLAALTGSKSINCSTLLPGFGHDVLNYPSMQLSLNKNRKEPTTVTFRRRVTNVGPAGSVYRAVVRAPKGVEVIVEPKVMDFSRVDQKRSFKVVVKAGALESGGVVSGELIWRSTRYVVRSPIVVYRSLDD